MIAISHLDKNQSDGRVQVVVQGNRSMSWGANVILAVSLCAVSMAVAVVLATYGLWMVIPFAGLEFVALLVCFYLTLRRLDQKEVITVGAHDVQLEWGYAVPEKSINLPRQWTRLRYHCKDSPFDTGQLSVAAYGRSYSLGNALGRDEKKKLYSELNIVLGGDFSTA